MRNHSKAALGAVDFVDWKYADNIKTLISNFKKKDISVIALEQDPRSVPIMQLAISNKQLALIVGNEVNGVSREVLDLADQIIEIPMRGKKNSLNVAVATGIALFELSK